MLDSCVPEPIAVVDWWEPIAAVDWWEPIVEAGLLGPIAAEAWLA